MDKGQSIPKKQPISRKKHLLSKTDRERLGVMDEVSVSKQEKELQSFTSFAPVLSCTYFCNLIVGLSQFYISICVR